MWNDLDPFQKGVTIFFIMVGVGVILLIDKILEWLGNVLAMTG